MNTTTQIRLSIPAAISKRQRIEQSRANLERSAKLKHNPKFDKRPLITLLMGVVYE